MKDGHSIVSPVIVGHTIYAFKDGGMERGLLNLVNYGDHDRFHHVILCLTQAGTFANRLRSPTCEVVELHKRPGNDLRLPGRIAATARRQRMHILHARGWPTLVETAMAARLAGVRTTIYGFHGKTMEDLAGLSLKRQWMQKVVIRCYQRVVTLNSRMRSELAAECRLPQNRIYVIANGVDTDTFRPREDRGTIRATFELPVDRFIIGNIARLDPVKNHEVIFRALHRLREHRCKPFFLLVGEGPHRIVLERQVAHLHIGEDVRLFGYSDHIPELLNCMDVYVQSSFYEGFSNTVLEAMACGLPVLATDVGGTRDLFSDDQGGGYFFQPQDDKTLASLILRLQQDSILRRTIGERVRRRAVQDFSVQNMVRHYENMYLELATAAVQPRA
jgi:sugar transferase (PEP-CTERM/EpsH1 system associated)